jgi:glucose dehydrogenase
MMKVSIKTSITAISLSLLFFFSSLSVPSVLASANSKPAALAATPLSTLQANWAYTNGNQFNQNYNPQNVINSSNAQYLGLSWLFPLPTHPTALLSVSGGLGVDTAPIIVNGTIYAVTQYGQVFALNAANGNVLWTDILPLTVNSTQGQNAGNLSLHLHDGELAFTTKLFGGTPTVWVSAPDHKAYAINAQTGAYELNFSYYGPGGVTGVQGNNPVQVYASSASNIVIDQQRGIAITSMLSSSSNNGARCFFRGWNVNVNPAKMLWESYCSPPQPGSNIPVDPNWDAKQVAAMKGAYIFKGYGYDNPGGYGGPNGAVDLKALSPAVLNSTLYNDWGYAPQAPSCSAVDGGNSPGATGAGWGASWISDPKTGIAYVNTGNKGPYNSPCTPGPDLWAAAVMAINETNGQWVWGFQTAAHELWDYDCSWQQALGNETIGGVSTQVLFKTCKSGYLFALNAATGAMLWSWTPPTSIMTRCHYCYMYDPLNRTEMTLAFFNPTLADTLMYPTEWAGSENEFGYNPALNYIVMVTHNVPLLTHYVAYNLTGYGHGSGETFPNSQANKNLDNSTIEAINAATGQMVWSHYVPTQGYRGGVTTSGNVVYLTFSSGDLLMLNAQTGTTIKDYYVGGPLNVLPSIGATASGQMEVVFPITAGLVTWGSGVPGDIVALTLQNVPPATTNVVTTSVTVSAPAQTSTSVSTVTASAAAAGVDTTTVYGIAAVAVIFIIATGYLAMRGRKPGP